MPQADALHLARWTVTSGSNTQSRGAVVIEAGDHHWQASSQGNGAVDALFGAVDRALAEVLAGHPRLVGYDVRALGRGSRCRVPRDGPDPAARFRRGRPRGGGVRGLVGEHEPHRRLDRGLRRGAQRDARRGALGGRGRIRGGRPEGEPAGEPGPAGRVRPREGPAGRHVLVRAIARRDRAACDVSASAPDARRMLGCARVACSARPCPTRPRRLLVDPMTRATRRLRRRARRLRRGRRPRSVRGRPAAGGRQLSGRVRRRSPAGRPGLASCRSRTS